jgi:molecular chaperone IbpA
MDRFDFSPLFRSTIGFDRLTRLVDAATRADNAALAYPPTTSKRLAKMPIG